jgi:4-hydroxy-tetrahydrodipicolinate synthase
VATRLTAETFVGIWAPIALPWDENYQLDEAQYRENLRRVVAAGVQGIYTTGSTGEGYALDLEEFQRIVDIMLEEVLPSGIATQACWYDLTTAKTVRALKYLQGTEIGAAQVALPFWMTLTEREMLKFWSDLSAACPDLPLVIYENKLTTGWAFRGADYQRIKEVAPTLIGTKAGFSGDLEGLIEAIHLTPDLSYMVRLDQYVAAWQHGARACHSALAVQAPQFPVQVYELLRAGRYEEAETLAQRSHGVLMWLWRLAEELGAEMHDPTFDKGVASLTGFLGGSRRTRPPYMAWSEAIWEALRSRLEKEHPEFMAR